MTEPTEHEQIIRAILVTDTNAESRMYRLKVFLFWLPLIWGVIYAAIWIVVLAMR